MAILMLNSYRALLWYDVDLDELHCERRQRPIGSAIGAEWRDLRLLLPVGQGFPIIGERQCPFRVGREDGAPGGEGLTRTMGIGVEGHQVLSVGDILQCDACRHFSPRRMQ